MSGIGSRAPAKTPRKKAGHRSWATKSVLLTKIRLDGDTQPRVEIDLDVVQEYADAYEAEATMPPLVVYFDGTDYWLADGFHRWHAARKAKLDKVSCEVRQGTKEDARWFSYSANQTHGVRRTNPDKAKAVKAALLHPNGAKMSDHQIAEYLGVSHTMVANRRKELESLATVASQTSRTGRDGRTIDTTNIGKRKCPNCGATTFDEDGDCTECREPPPDAEPDDDPAESPTTPQDATEDEDDSEGEEAEEETPRKHVDDKEPFGEQLWLVLTRFWKNQYPEVPAVTVADYLEEIRERVLRGEQ